jgi:hypothetical protein
VQTQLLAGVFGRRMGRTKRVRLRHYNPSHSSHPELPDWYASPNSIAEHDWLWSESTECLWHVHCRAPLLSDEMRPYPRCGAQAHDSDSAHESFINCSCSLRHCALGPALTASRRAPRKTIRECVSRICELAIAVLDAL